MVINLVLELDYPFLHISTLEDVYINLALYKCFLLTYLQVILDDKIITGSNDSDHLQNLEAVLQRLAEFGLRANMTKCVFLKDKIVFCGHSVDRNGLHQYTDKVKAITEARRPTNVSEVKSFTGMVNYYHKFSAQYSKRLIPIA